MMIHKLAIPRRTFLRGAGTMLALPLLDAMVPVFTAQAQTAAAPVTRLQYVYRPNGYVKQYWTPDKVGRDFDMKRSLNGFEPFRDRMTIISGLANLEAEAKGSSPGPHSRSSACWLTGTHAKQTEGADVYAGISADQIAAAQLGKSTILPSLEVAIEQNEQVVGNCEAGYSCLYQNTFSWHNETTPLPMETHPRVVFQRLFGDGTNRQEAKRQLQTTGSILDDVTERISEMARRLGPGDRTRLTQYLDSVREIENRIQKAERRTEDASIDLPERPSDIPSTFEDHVKLMFDLQALAFQADITRVVTFQMARELSPRTYPNIGVLGQHHATSHQISNPAKADEVAKIDAYHMKLVQYYLAKLESIPEGDGTLLDHVILQVGGGLGNPGEHAVIDLTNLIFGGKSAGIKGNTHIAYKVEDYVPQANLLITNLGLAGVNIDKIGDSTGRLKEIPL